MSNQDISMDAIKPIMEAWQIIENTLVEAGLGVDHASRVSKAIVARLAQSDPPILLAYPDQLKD